jgi:hypothetical protein
LSMCQTTKCILVVSLLQNVASFVWCLELAWLQMIEMCNIWLDRYLKGCKGQMIVSRHWPILLNELRLDKWCVGVLSMLGLFWFY